MKVKDIVYGIHSVTEPVLVALLKSISLQRLRGVSQLSLPAGYSRLPWFSRYEHSVGTMLLLRHLGASLDEQVAGLLHDVSHTAFSHLIDYVMDRSVVQDYQDENHLKFIKQTELPTILARYGLVTAVIANTKQFTLLEQSIPYLCADRVDYALREIAHEGKRKEAKFCFDHLAVHKQHIVFTNIKAAELFGRLYIHLLLDDWGSHYAVTRSHVLANVLRYALKKRIITIEEVQFLTDAQVIALLQNSDVRYVVKTLALLQRAVYDEQFGKVGEPITIKTKMRYVDPTVLVGSKVYKLSAVNEAYAETLRNLKQTFPAGITAKLPSVLH